MKRRRIFFPVCVHLIFALMGHSAFNWVGLGTREALTAPVYLPLVLKPQPALPPGVQVLSNYSYYTDIIDHIHVVGEIANNTPDSLRFIRVTVNFFNGSGQLLIKDFSYTFLEDLPPYDKTCFDVSVPIPIGWSSFQFDPLSYWTDGSPLTNLVLSNVSGTVNPLMGWYEITGQVRNNYGSRVEYVRPVATLYNAAGIVIGCDLTFVEGDHLDPNQTGPFTLIAIDSKDVSTYNLQVTGNLP